MVVICERNNEHNKTGEGKIEPVLLDFLSHPLMHASSCDRGSALSLVVVSHALRVTSSFHSFADAVKARRTFRMDTNRCCIPCGSVTLRCLRATQLITLPPLLRGLLRSPARHVRLLPCSTGVLHELMRARTRLVGILRHVLIAWISHRTHRLILLNRSSVHRSAALSVVKLCGRMHW